MNYFGQDKRAHERVKPALGVLITNLGTPEAPTARALRPYLRQFLSDPRVVELPRWKWWPILHGIILRVRPAKSARLYASVWTEQGSPLMQIGLAQRDRLAAALERVAPGQAVVKLAMRYGQPAIDKVLREFQNEGVRRLVVVPLYPQYAGATTGSTWDAVAQALTRWRWVPELHFVSTYHDHPLYIQALCDSIRAHFAAHGQPQRLVLSYHGMPQRYLDNGDPYYCFCQKTTRLVREQLGLDETQCLTVFQSQFGREAWIQPDVSSTLRQLAADGIAHVAVACPGFSADCLETLEEIAVENRALFLAAGGREYHYIPALNDRDDHIALMTALVRPHL